MIQKGVLLINLGSPDQCNPGSVRRYLRQFLNDPRVVALSWFIRWPLVNLLIIPFRYQNTTHAYSQIWGETGSPLIMHTRLLADAVAEKLGDEYRVVYGMRYGSPAISEAVTSLKGCESITVVPLFPQYSSAATGSVIEAVYRELASQWNMPSLRMIGDFYGNQGFIKACSSMIQPYLIKDKPDLILFSYHGLPESHITMSECQAACDHLSACPLINGRNRFCYRAQCYETTRLITENLGLQLTDYAVSFQSRLGRTPWIKPYTDLLLNELVQKGVKRLAVVCPSFVSDCLETLEEINIRARLQWQSLGGTEFIYIPCVNESPVWVEALSSICS